MSDGAEATLIAVTCASEAPAAVARAEELAIRLGLPTCAPDARDLDLLLAVTDTRLEVRQPGSRTGPVFADFVAGRFGHRASLELRHELVVRAVGFRGEPLEVIDMTAGLGRDAMVLALAGCRVTTIEAHPVVYELLADGLRRASEVPALARVIEERLRLVRGDAVTYLETLPPDAAPDVVYLDPMFPARTQSALVKKEMVVLARLAGHGDDAARLFEAALATSAHRIVVKRPRHAPPLEVAGSPPRTLHIEGRAARFDVYARG